MIRDTRQNTKNAHAVALGRKGGKARLQTMTAEERSARAREAAQARWGNKSKPVKKRTPSTSK